jgi:hypothetical protein
MRKLLFALAVMFGAVAAIGQASALTLNPNPTDFDIETVGPGHFQVAYDFTLTQDSDVKFGGISAFIANFNVGICSSAACPVSDILDVASKGSFLFLTFAQGAHNALAAGTYYLLVAGDASPFGGKYLAALNAVPVSATPIPAPILLLLTGIAGLGVFGYRRRATSPAAV